MPMLRTVVLSTWLLVVLMPGSGKSGQEEGIPVTDPLVIAKCGSCHTTDKRGNMLRISWERATPEAWEGALKRMIRMEGVTLAPPEARAILKYLSTYHGLAPEEAKMVMYYAERRTQEETIGPNDNLRDGCSKCHVFARTLSWRRSLDDWKQLANLHLAVFPQSEQAFRLGANLDALVEHAGSAQALPGDEAVALLGKIAPLHTPEWTAWRAQMHLPKLAGRWLLTAELLGHGKYFGQMEVEPGAADDEFNTHVKLESAQDGSSLERSGHSLVYAGYAWRGRSTGANAASAAPDDLSNAVREVMWLAPDQSRAEGRWFWGQYQEFGFEVKMQRAYAGATLLGVDRWSLKTGSQANRIRLIGDNLPGQVAPADLNFGPGVTVQRIVSSNPHSIVAEVSVAANALPGRRDVAFRRSVAPGAIAIYDRVDYIKVLPESAVAQFGGQTYPKGYQQFEAIGYQRGADGQPHTADDVNLGPIEVEWSLEAFNWIPGGDKEFVGKLSSTGLFTPASEGPATSYDVWVIAKARNEKDQAGKALAGKSYLVVSLPVYTFDGRRYVRELGRWVEEGKP